MNVPQRWLTGFGLVFLVSEAVHEVAFYVLTSSREYHDDELTNGFRVWMAVCYAVLLYSWWRGMQWIDRRALEPERRTHARLYMRVALVTGSLRALATLAFGESETLFDWLHFPWLAACWAVGMTLAGAVTPDEMTKLTRTLRLITILWIGLLILDVVVWVFWLGPKFST